MEKNTLEFLNDMKLAYELLADEESKQTFLERLSWIVTGDYQYIKKTVSRVLPGVLPRELGGVSSVLESIPENASIIMWGLGQWGRKYYPSIKKDGRLKYICDSDNKKTGVYYETEVVSPDDYMDRYDGEYVIITSWKFFEDIKNQIINTVSIDRIKNIESCVLRTTRDTYFRSDIIHYVEEEVFVDAGCKNLDTSIQLSKLCNLKKVYAFEPDEENYKKCYQKKDSINGCEVCLHKLGTWNEKSELRFDATNDGCSHITDEGNVIIKVDTIDSIIPTDENVTFIKMDVEGAEYNSILGAINTIKRCHPKLAICIYHKPEDILDIELLIHSISSDYKFYIRHHSNYWNETVLYAV